MKTEFTALTSDKGYLYAFTTLQRDQLPDRFHSQAPITVALVDIVGGPRVTAQITDLDSDTRKALQIGDVVVLTTRKLNDGDGEHGVLPYGFKFRPEF